MRLLMIVAAAALVAAGCSSNDQDGPTPGAVVNQPSTPALSSAPATSTTPKPDPYEVYLAHAPKGEPTLSREDASTRALLGCGKKWPPGTVDAVLAEAYADLCR